MANHYILDGGSGDGSAWNNAWDDLPATFTRGDTYYVGAGTYGGHTLDTAVSGTDLITIKGATATDHGTETGWNAAYSVAVSPAHFTAQMSFTSATKYWVFDGAVGSGNTSSSYGFVFDDSGSGNAYCFQLAGVAGQTYQNITISHVYAAVSNRDNEKVFLQTTDANGYINNITVSYCYFVGWQCILMPGYLSGAFTGWLFEHNYIYQGWGSETHHAEDINSNGAGFDGIIIRYNIFDTRGATGSTGCIQANNGNIQNAKIYGNIFHDINVSNGVIAGSTSPATAHINSLIYNNTFIECDVSTNQWFWGGAGAAAGNYAYNNMFYKTEARHGTGLADNDYNAYFQCADPQTETHGQISAAGEPFVNPLSDYHLSAHTDAGKTDLGAEYGTDMDGVARATWDRGAYEYASSATPWVMIYG